MGKGKSAPAPAAPDPVETARAEAQFNRLDTYSPSGSGVRHGYTNSAGQFVQGSPPAGYQAAVSQLESPWERSIRQALEPASVDLTNRVIRDNIQGMPNAPRLQDRDKIAAGLPDGPRVQDRGNIAQTIFDRSFAMMMPAIEKGNTRLLNNLQARGIPIGSKAFNDAYGEQQTRTQDTISRLAMDADVAAGQEQSRLFGLDDAAARFDLANFATAGQEQSRLFGLDATSRQNSIAELVAAMGGNYNPPSATPSGSAAGVDYSGLVGQKYQGDMAQWQNAQNQRSSTMSTLGGLGGALLMKSSRDLKEDHGIVSIHDVAERVTRIPIHEWTYAPGVHVPGSLPGQRHVGPMAQDFQEIFGLGDGRHIHTIDAFGICMAALKSALLRIEVLERRSFGEVVN